MSNKKSYLLLSICCALLVINKSYCQDNFLPGFIITATGDSIQGLINYKNWKINPDKISFKKEDQSAVVEYTPTDLEAFSVSNEKYKSSIVQIEISPINQDRYTMSHSAKFETVTDTVFLQGMSLGKYNFYHLYTKKGREYFYIEFDEQINLLKYKQYVKDEKIVENNKYLAQLSYYFQDCPTIQHNLSKVNYDQKSIYEIMEHYLSCTDTKNTFVKAQDKNKTEFGVLLGSSLSTLNFSGDIPALSDLTDTKFSSSLNFSGGLYFETFLARNQKKWSLVNELLYSTYSLEGHQNQILKENEFYTLNDMSLSYSYIKMMNQIRFNYPIKEVSIFVNIGISNGIAIKDENVKVTKTKFYSTESVETKKAVEYSRRYEQGLVFGIGTKYAKYSLQMRYEIGNAMSTNSQLGSTSKRFYVFLSYRFK